MVTLPSWCRADFWQISLTVPYTSTFERRATNSFGLEAFSTLTRPIVRKIECR